MLEALARRRMVSRRVALVVAHPDDETIAAGGSLRLMPGLMMVHVTDGAPRTLDDARRKGFEHMRDYAAARETELRAALSLAGVAPRRVQLGVPDQEASYAMPSIAGALSQVLIAHEAEVVMTHAYEGGHPDHDATAFAVHQAAARLGLPVVEFAGYHAGPDGELTVQRFLPGPGETHVRLLPEEAADKRAMLDCFRTQRDILSMFGASVERFRPAPGYDFSAPPHEGQLNYERWGWEMTGERWRGLAQEATWLAD